MNNEIFFGIVAFLLVWEAVYILWMKYNKKHKNENYLSRPDFAFNTDDWGLTKLFSFLIATIIFVSQIGIIGYGNKNYINLLWEFLIILAIVMLFYANKLIAGLINGENGQSTTRRTRTST